MLTRSRTRGADDSDDGRQRRRSAAAPSQGRRQQWGGTGTAPLGLRPGAGTSGGSSGGSGGGGGGNGSESIEDGFDFEAARAGLPGLDMGMQGGRPKGQICGIA